MTASIRLLSVLATLAFCLPASATETAPTEAHPAAAATAVPATAATAPIAPAAQAAKPAEASAAKPSAGQSEAVTRVPPGYKTKVIDGETHYCRKSTPLGSRFPTEVCMTVAQYQESVRQGDGLRQELTGKQKSFSINQ